MISKFEPDDPKHVYSIIKLAKFHLAKKELNELLFLSENLFRLTFQITLPY